MTNGFHKSGAETPVRNKRSAIQAQASKDEKQAGGKPAQVREGQKKNERP